MKRDFTLLFKVPFLVFCPLLIADSWMIDINVAVLLLVLYLGASFLIFADEIAHIRKSRSNKLRSSPIIMAMPLSIIGTESFEDHLIQRREPPLVPCVIEEITFDPVEEMPVWQLRNRTDESFTGKGL